jgi:pyridoxine/pyridoxamine 5'-phosphate oxidase
VTDIATAAVSLPMKDKLRLIPSLKGPFRQTDFDAFPATPHEAFASWLDEALAEGIIEPHAMTLSTVDGDGWPDARVLILKNVDVRGWHFAINADSEDVESARAKARSLLQANPRHIAPGWRVYAVAPSVAEFWQGASDRNHKRLQYSLCEGGTWEKRRLWP